MPKAKVGTVWRGECRLSGRRRVKALWLVPGLGGESGVLMGGRAGPVLTADILLRESLYSMSTRTKPSVLLVCTVGLEQED